MSDMRVRDVGEAANYIGAFCRRWGRIDVTQTKEKYGTARVYCNLNYTTFHNLLYPGYHFKRPFFPAFLFSDFTGMKFFSLPGIHHALFAYKRFIYRLAYKRALKLWPHTRRALLDTSDYTEFLEGL